MQYDSKIGNGSKTSKREVRLVTEVRVVMAVSEVGLVRQRRYESITCMDKNAESSLLFP